MGSGARQLALVVCAAAGGLVSGCYVPEQQGEPAGRPGRADGLAVLVIGTGTDGFSVNVVPMQDEATEQARAVFEAGSFVFRLYAADASRMQPDLKRPLGEWRFDETVSRGLWTRGMFGLPAYVVPLPWQGSRPPPRSSLVLVTEFTPQGRSALRPHLAPFEVDSRVGTTQPAP
jgi:hypothetical protein